LPAACINHRHRQRGNLFLASLSLGFALSAHSVSFPLKPKPKQPKPIKVNLGIFEGQTDVGTVLPPGTAQFDPGQKTYTLTGSGANMWMTRDVFHFVWKKVSGDVSLSADIAFPNPGGNAHRKAALLIRQSLDADALYADAALHGSGLTALQFRPESGATTQDIELNFSSITDAPTRLRIDKRGDQITVLLGKKGEPLHPAGTSKRLHLDGSFYVGLGICSHDPNTTEKAVFSNVDFHTIAESTDTSATTAKRELYSTLQTISIDADNRRAAAIYTAPGHFEAPNWTRDGNALIFDQNGKLMTVPADGKLPASVHPIDIGLASGCNGSHGLSPDGKLLAISCNMPDAPGSRVYIVPSSGGTPRLVTANPSSYFHSWSPDGKTIAFTRPHQGGGDIYSISADGGEEMALTATVGISDDPDYSPDGQYIYFNSDRGGTMQIWRMHADGSQSEQVTSDEMNNWTPHVSPDGKWMVFLSYDKSVTGHPANKDISLRLMSLSDKKITKLVDLLGGSGTINVPSWSPDSHSLAYVSYELIDAEKN
jgi:TolB protein